MSDEQALELLRLLWQYLENYTDQPSSMTVVDLAVDLAQSMSVTTDEADVLRFNIESLR
jgi:hypothetical protein